MAQATSIRFGKTAILLGDGATPTEAFSAPCGFDNLTMEVVVNTSETAIPDCADPDLAVWLVSDVVSQQMRLTGSGLLDADDLIMWQTWWLTDAGKERNVRWFRDLTAPQGGGYFQAPGILTSYRETGQRGQRWQIAIGINLNGKPVFTPAS